MANIVREATIGSLLSRPGSSSSLKTYLRWLQMMTVKTSGEDDDGKNLRWEWIVMNCFIDDKFLRQDSSQSLKSNQSLHQSGYLGHR